eukprot:CAMPEP_0172498510 /NCGR_PEP_ID=MMETSP1066-20121228/113478_1 /TAXON_ID=671091 /ORGANISM="Coscinodiscus wailesii, Strain CCMP2513" /LENGTH=459 /DNA_ID=CAMNT_0013271803 /DNA_START=50 /DNA_END=1427 /DNA_ORIENTATION=-
MKSGSNGKSCLSQALHSTNTKERKEAIGAFPHEADSDSSRHDMLLKSAHRGQPSLQLQSEDTSFCKTNAQNASSDENPTLALSDLNSPNLYVPTKRSETCQAIPKPVDELDWLAQVPEEGQTFNDYITAVTTRRTGRIKPLANPDGIDIFLLPILRTERVPVQRGGATATDTPGVDGEAAGHSWPSYGPPLEPLIKYTSAFFDRHVHLLPPALVFATKLSGRTTGGAVSEKKRKRNDSTLCLDASASSTSKGNFKLYFPQTSDGKIGEYANVAGRADFRSDRIQLKVDSLLDELSAYRYNQIDTGEFSSHGKDFCVMGITMEDLYDKPKDLFCAGMAFGRDKVAVFSFARYHPFLKMHPLHWHHYGYTRTCDGYSYYEDDDQDPKGLTQDPPDIVGMKDKDVSEFLRRSSKLLTHELGHLYVLDHCIHNKCLMMGTGHLVEDFKAPSHLCGVCLRKLQW